MTGNKHAAIAAAAAAEAAAAIAAAEAAGQKLGPLVKYWQHTHNNTNTKPDK